MSSSDSLIKFHLAPNWNTPDSVGFGQFVDWGYALRPKDSPKSFDQGSLKSLLYRQQEHIFDRINSEFIRDTEWVSSESDMVSHPHYQRLVDMGDVALTIMLRRMDKGTVYGQWFSLLVDLAKDSPISPQSQGFAAAMTADWLRWGRLHCKM